MARPSERERLTQLIQQWNIDHYDLFELSAPNQELEFHGVVRFYFQGGAGANVITKCIRVSSTASTSDVIDILIEKFRPDMRMLTENKYALYEVHVNGEERRLGDAEKLLWVQLNWGKDVREGRFLLKNENEKTVRDPALGFKEPAKEENNFKRKLSKREKKEKKKRDQERANQNESVSSKLYTEAPETSFTRSISNPEAVMRRRRQQKLEKKLAEMQSQQGGQDSGGTLKIYGESLRPDVPYKTLLLSTADTAAVVIKEALEKYGLEQEDPELYCLVEVLLPPGSQEYHGGSVGDERVLDDGECPLAISLQHARHREKGTLIFQLRRRSSDSNKRRNKRQRAVSHDDLRKSHEQPATQADKLPYLLDLNPRDGPPEKHLLPLNITEVVRDGPVTPGNQFLQLSGPDIFPRHCVFAHTEGIVTVVPTARDAEVYVDNRRVKDTTMLRHGMTVQFGRHHFFKFLDPRFEEIPKRGQPVPAPRGMASQETNFDVDGHVETVTQLDKEPMPGRTPGNQQGTGSNKMSAPDLLPVSLDYKLEVEDRLLQAVVLDVQSRGVQFKLAPTYVLYLAARRLLLLPSQRIALPAQHTQHIVSFVNRTAKLIQKAIQEHHNDPTTLAFWIANASEVLHFFKQDVDVQRYGTDSHELLAEAVQMAFHHLVRCLQGDLQRVMPAFLDPSDAVDDENIPQDQYSQGQPMLADVLNTLSAAMTLLRRCRVNAALTIQLFSQLFHFINMWLFNILVTEPQLQLCTRVWGVRLKRRLGRIEAWAEKQGLELAADCHLCRIIQAAHLLQAPKMTGEDINNISSTCFKLNSIQLRALLTGYMPDHREPPVSTTFVERIVAMAENTADELTKTDGGEVRLEEDPDLHLPFLLPEDGYSCDTVRGIPNGLPEFVQQLTNAGICQMTANSRASGSWTVYMGQQQMKLEPPDSPLGDEPEIMVVTFKKLRGSMGLSIVAAIGEGLTERGIYIKSVVPGGAAAQDGRLKAGDQLLEVDGRSLVGLTQDKAAEQMTQTGDLVTLKVAKQGAIYHGLATLLEEPSPTVQRPPPTKVSMAGDEEPPPPYVEYQQESPSGPMQSRPVPQPRGQNQTRRDGLDSTRSPSAGNLSQQQSYAQSQLPEPSRFTRREVDPRSKSTSNLHADTSFDESDQMPGMRGAKSVGMLHPADPGYAKDFGGNDYENHPQVSPSTGYGEYDQDYNHSWSSRGGNPTNQSQPPARRPSDRSSVSSRSSSNSGRDARPHSAYYETQKSLNDDPNNYDSKVSVDKVTQNKLRDWQEKYDSGGKGQGFQGNEGRPGPQYGNRNPGSAGERGAHSEPSVGRNQLTAKDGSGSQPSSHNAPSAAISKPGLGSRGNVAAGHSGLYASIGPPAQNRPKEASKLSARERLFGKQSGPATGVGGLKPTPGSQQRQTGAAGGSQPGRDMAPPQQTQASTGEVKTKPKPAVKPKPPVAKKPQLKVKPTELNHGVMNDAQTQPGIQQEGLQQHQAGFPPTSPGYHGSRPDNSRPMEQQDPRFSQQDRRHEQQGSSALSPGQRNNRFLQGPYGQPDPYAYPLAQPGDDLQDFPPPPPLDEDENSPPLPPPPPMEDLLEHQLLEEQQRLAGQSGPGRGEEPPPPPSDLHMSFNRYSQPAHTGSDRKGFGSRGFEPQSPHSPHPPHGLHPQDQANYQNIDYMQGGAGSPQFPAPPPLDHDVDHSHGSGSGLQPPQKNFRSVSPSLQQSRPPQQQPPQGSSSRGREGPKKPDDQQKNEYDARAQEILDLETRSYLSFQDQERLRRLKLEHEFQRRVREVEEKGEDDGDEDDEMVEHIFSRERLIQSLKGDLEQSKQRVEELAQCQNIREAHLESQRMQKLQQRLEELERERHEMQNHVEQQQQNRTREHQQQLLQQKEAREKQRQNYEEQKRFMEMEEEKMRQRREEELMKRRQMEQDHLHHMQRGRRDDEHGVQGGGRNKSDSYATQQMQQERQQHRGNGDLSSQDSQQPSTPENEGQRSGHWNSSGRNTLNPGYQQRENMGPGYSSRDTAGPGNQQRFATGPGNQHSMPGPGYQQNSATGPGNPHGNVQGPGQQRGNMPGPRNQYNNMPGHGYQQKTAVRPGNQRESDGRPGYQQGNASGSNYPDDAAGQGYQGRSAFGQSNQHFTDADHGSRHDDYTNYDQSRTMGSGYQHNNVTSDQRGGEPEPGYQHGSNAGPRYQHGNNVGPGYQHSSDRGPGYQHGSNAGPGYQYGNDAGAGYQHGSNAERGYQHGSNAGPGYHHGNNESPGYQRDNNVGQGYPHGSNPGPGYQHGYSTGPGYQHGQNAKPGQHGSSTGPGYPRGGSAEQGYPYGTAGPHYQDGNSAGPGGQPGNVKGPGYQSGNNTGPGYQQGNNGDQRYNKQGHSSASDPQKHNSREFYNEHWGGDYPRGAPAGHWF